MNRRVEKPGRIVTLLRTVKRHRRCGATTMAHGQVQRCVLPRDHFSAHYNDHLWWANNHGLPIQRQRQKSRSLWQVLVERLRGR